MEISILRIMTRVVENEFNLSQIYVFEILEYRIFKSIQVLAPVSNFCSLAPVLVYMSSF